MCLKGTMKGVFVLFLVVVPISGFLTGGAPALCSRSTSALGVVTNAAPVASKTKAPIFDEVCETTGVTLKRFMVEVAMLNPEITELTTLFGAIETACKAIAK